jgi:hypothetical protein
MNQITENIACNSELYSHILDTSANNRRLYKVLDNIEKTIKHSMSPNLFTEPPEGGFIPAWLGLTLFEEGVAYRRNYRGR